MVRKGEQGYRRIDRKLVRRLAMEGRSTKEIARRVKASRTYVQRLRKGMGVPATRRKPQTIHIPTNPLALGYLAGLIDGEGTVMIVANGKGAKYPTVQISNTDKKMINWILDHVGGYATLQHRSRPGRSEKDCWEWHIHAVADVRALLRALIPCLVTKRERAREVLEFIEVTKYGRPVAWNDLNEAPRMRPRGAEVWQPETG